jgi:hypothetical protein
VIGDKPFSEAAFEVVKERFPQAQMKKGQASLMTALDGYRRLAADAGSRLGWRTITLFFGFEGCDDLVRRALERADLAPELPEKYREEHLALAELVRRLLEDEALSAEEEQALSNALGMDLAEIKEHLAIGGDDDVQLEGEDGEPPEDAPTILFTSLVGAKGLSASTCSSSDSTTGSSLAIPRRSPMTRFASCSSR